MRFTGHLDKQPLSEQAFAHLGKTHEREGILMEWYWWLLIGIAVVGIGWLKLKVMGNWMKKRQEKQKAETNKEDF